jgi:hypothetical protein
MADGSGNRNRGVTTTVGIQFGQIRDSHAASTLGFAVNLATNMMEAERELRSIAEDNNF